MNPIDILPMNLLFCQLIMPVTMVDPPSTLYRCIQESFPGLDVSPVDRSHFHENEGMYAPSFVDRSVWMFRSALGLDYIKKFAVAEQCSSILQVVSSKYYCLAAAGALLKYDCEGM
jgi:hypothetical protein